MRTITVDVIESRPGGRMAALPTSSTALSPGYRMSSLSEA